jgi:hypothetical protein
VGGISQTPCVIKNNFYSHDKKTNVFHNVRTADSLRGARNVIIASPPASGAGDVAFA